MSVNVCGLVKMFKYIFLNKGLNKKNKVLK